MTESQNQPYYWMLDELVDAVDRAVCAVVVSADGLVVQKSNGISRDDADALAALASSLASVTSAFSDRFAGGPVSQTIVELQNQYLVVRTAGPNARLALITDADADLGQVAYEMNRLIRQVGRKLGSTTRPATA
jgi:predicted regulator of Ras-like GTPase activity (Roadblock/LC7/MglB family)